MHPPSLDHAPRSLGLLLAGTLLAGCGAGPDGGAAGTTFDGSMAGPLTDSMADPFADGDRGPDEGDGDPAPGAEEPPPVDGPATNASADAVPGSGDAIRVVGALERLAATAFVELAGALETGRPLEAAERACLADHDPSTGAPPTVLRCAIPLVVGGTPVSVRAVELDPDDACLAAMGDAARDVTSVVDGCEWLSAAFTLDVEWIEPSGTGPDRRPRPLDGAEIDYTAASGRLALRSLSRPLTGTFDCGIDLARLAFDGTVDGTGDGTCPVRISGMAGRLERHAGTGVAGP